MAKRIDANSYDSTRVKREELKRLIISGLFSLLVVGLFFWATFELFPLTAWLPKTVTSGGTVILLDWGLLGNMVSVVTLLWWSVEWCLLSANTLRTQISADARLPKPNSACTMRFLIGS